MEFNIEKVCCFTGHRPEKCKGTEEEIRARLATEIQNAIGEGYNTFITGMAPGVDTWAADEVLKIKSENKEIKLIAAVPFPGVEKNRTAELQDHFKAIIGKTDDVQYVYRKYRRWVFHARDAWMVDHESRVLAVFNRSPGGTEWTINYAKMKNCEIVFIVDE
ncbi:MAG: DUF1273 family protein [Clostridiales bacterium]|nr:DUF1273 family protein [Candidatus Coliplasma caballi]